METSGVAALAWTQFWQLTIVILAIGLVVGVFCRRRPHLAYVLWMLAMAKCLTPPVWSSPTSVFSWASATTSDRAAVVAGPVKFTLPPGSAPSVGQPDGASPMTSPIRVSVRATDRQIVAPPANRLQTSTLLACIWLAGTAATALLLIVKSAVIRHRIRASSVEPPPELSSLLDDLRASLGVRRRVRLTVSREPLGPALAGLFRPRLVVPQALLGEKNVAELRPILAHELVHLRRGDLLVSAFQSLALAVWWFHPLVWWMQREINRTRELSCDEEVIASLDCEPAAYAQALLDVLRMRRHLSRFAFSVGMRPLQVTTERLEHVMSDKARFHRRTPRIGWALLAVCGLLLLPGRGIALGEKPSASSSTNNQRPAIGANTRKAEPLTYRGTVIDYSNDKPIKGATVAVKLSSGMDDERKLIQETRQVTDSSGNCQFTIPAQLAADPTLFVEWEVSHPRYASFANESYLLSMLQRTEEQSGERLFKNLFMLPGAELTGVVEDPDGKPVPNVLIRFSPRHPARLNPPTKSPSTFTTTTDKKTGATFTFQATIFDAAIDTAPHLSGSFGATTTDQQGHFRFNVVEGEVTPIWIYSKDYLPYLDSLSQQPGNIQHIRLKRGVRLTGKVIDSQDQPVAGAFVHANSEGNGIRREARTNANGEFNVAPVEPGKYRLYVDNRVGDYFSTRRMMPAAPLPALFLEAKTVDVTTDKPPEPLVIRGTPGVSVRAHFLDSSGKSCSTGELFISGQANGNPDAVYASGGVDARGIVELKVPKSLRNARASAQDLLRAEQSAFRFRRGKNGALRGGSLRGVGVGTIDNDVDDLEVVRYRAPVLVIKAFDPHGKLIRQLKPGIRYAGDSYDRDPQFQPFPGQSGDLNWSGNRDGSHRTSNLLPDQEFTLTVEAEGYRPISQTLRLSQGETKELDMRLTAAEDTPTSDVEKRPATAAAVTATDPPIVSPDAKQDAKSDAAAAEATKQDADAEPEKDDPTPSGATLRGRVVLKSTGAAAPHANVRMLSQKGNGFNSSTTTTDAQGEFVFDNVPPGLHQVFALADNLASRQERGHGTRVDFDAAHPPTETVVLKLSPAPSIKAHVTAKASGAPVADANVALIGTDIKGDHKTDAEGNVVLRGLTPEVWHVQVHALGCAEQVQPVNLSGDQRAELIFALEPGGSVRGVVKDDAGKPLADVGISVFPADFSGGQIAFMHSDAEGHYRFDFLPLDKPLQFNCWDAAYQDLQRKFSLAADGKRDIDLDLELRHRPDGGSVRGLVTDRTGKPIAGARVTNSGRSSSQERKAKTDAEGRFALDNVYENGNGHELIIKATGFAPEQVAFQPAPRSAPAEITIKLAPGNRIRGRVQNSAGQPIAEARVVYAHGDRFPGGDAGGSATTDSEGRFYFDSLPARPPFTFYAKGHSEISETFLPLNGDDVVVVTMQPQGVLRGRVVDAATGAPITRFNVRITFSPDRRQNDPSASLGGPRDFDGERFVATDGQFRLDDLVVGMPLQVSVEAERYDTVTERRVLAQTEPDAKVVEFKLPPIDPAALATVHGEAPKVEESAKAVRKPLPTIAVPPPEQTTLPAANADVPKRLIKGVVTDVDGKPVAGAEVWLRVRWISRDRRWVTAHAACGDDGKFRLEFPAEWVPTDPTQQFPAVWAYAPGHAIGTFNAYDQLNAATDVKPCQIKLGPPAENAFQILRPDGTPAVGALVEPSDFFCRQYVYEPVPSEILAKTTAVTDDQGRVTLPAFPRKAISGVNVHAPKFGTQSFEVNARLFAKAADGKLMPLSAETEDELTLKPVSRIEGRVLAEQAELFRDMFVVVTTFDYNGERRPQAHGKAEVPVDAQGRFVVPEIAVGKIDVFASVDKRLPVRPRLPARNELEVSAGETTTVEIPLEMAVHVHGVLRVKGTHQPIADARISVGYGIGQQSDRATSDENGNYSAYVLSGDVRLQVIYVPGKYVQLGDTFREKYPVPADKAEFDLPPIEVEPTQLVKGRLLDRDAKPLAGALISGVVGERSYGFGKSDEKGDFSLSRVPSSVKLDRFTVERDRQIVDVEVETRDPLVLRVK